MEFDFDDCYWHDSILESIYIDRSTPGEKDVVEMVVDWYEEQPKSKLIFNDVRLFKATMNNLLYRKRVEDSCYRSTV